MIRTFPASERHTANLGWLVSGPVYSFGNYQDPERNGFGVMRVCNDDRLAPGKGFGAHPHSDMEIVSIVLSGRIRHEDNLGNRVVTGFGEVQRMSAGSGIIHTEFNDSDEEELRLLQLWFMPKERGTAPSYEARAFDPERLRGALLPVVANDAGGAAASIGQDMAIYLSKLDRGQRLNYGTAAGRKLFLYAIEGAFGANGAQLAEGDTAELEEETALTLEAKESSFLMLVDMP